MFEQFKKIRKGAVIAMMGLLGLMFGLSSPSVNFIEKISITIVCFIIMVIGVLLESPFVRDLVEGQEQPIEEFTRWDS